MRRSLLTIIMLGVATFAMAQSAKQETAYRRSSLYSIMLPDEKLSGEELDLVKDAFLKNAFPDKYNEHNLDERVLDLAAIKAIEVTKEEVDAAEASTGKKSKFGALAKKGLSMAGAAAGVTSGDSTISDAQYVAKITKYFNEHNVAGAMVAKWFGGGNTKPAAAQALNTALIEERGLGTLSQEELSKAEQSVGGKEKLVAAAEYDLMNRTFVTVNRYAYLSAEEIIDYITAATGGAGGGIAAAALKKVLKGYFVKTTTYLFQLDLSDDKINELVEKYGSDISGLYTDESIKFKYVGKTWDYAPAALSLSLKADALAKLINRATVRATDGSVQKLQKKYEQFKTLATLHQDGENLYAYVGKKEGCKEGDKFEVLQKTIDKNGNEVYDVVGTVKIEKGKLWDNRAGANEKIEGAAADKDDDKTDTALTYSSFGTSKKLWDGALIRQVK